MGHRILVVDDEELVREAFQAFLQIGGYDADTADSVDQARQKLAQVRYDLVITDMKMPGEDGMSLINYMNEAYEDLMVIMITGNPEPEVTYEAFKGGIVEFIVKPVDRKHLLATVERLLSSQSSDADKESDEIDELLKGLTDDSSDLPADS